MRIHYKRKSISVSAKKARSFKKFSGLMFRSLSKSQNLLFEFNKETSISFHSYFVFFKFMIIWLDSKNKVIEYKIVKPFSLKISCQKKFKKCLEIPLKNKNKKIIDFFVGNGKI